MLSFNSTRTSLRLATNGSSVSLSYADDQRPSFRAVTHLIGQRIALCLTGHRHCSGLDLSIATTEPVACHCPRRRSIYHTKQYDVTVASVWGLVASTQAAPRGKRPCMNDHASHHYQTKQAAQISLAACFVELVRCSRCGFYWVPRPVASIVLHRLFLSTETSQLFCIINPPLCQQ